MTGGSRGIASNTAPFIGIALILWIAFFVSSEAPGPHADGGLAEPVAAQPASPPVGVSIVELQWTQDGTSHFEGRTVSAPRGYFVATDGTGFFYATADEAAGTDAGVAECMNRLPTSAGEVALIDSTTCVWAGHPGIACSGNNRPCEDALGMPPHAEPHVDP